MTELTNFPNGLQVAVVGASGAIGSAMVEQLAASPQVDRVYACSRAPAEDYLSGKVVPVRLNPLHESELAAVAAEIAEPLDMLLVTTGMLHQDSVQPEKRLASLEPDSFMQLMQVNTLLPMLVARYLLPCLRLDRRAVFGALSARVGSISDNRLGGWYSYRASKAALNMLLKTLAIEVQRTHPHLIVCGLHPGTVDSALSAPFQRNVPEGKLFTAEYSAGCLLQVINSLQQENSGQVLAWDGQPISP